MPCRFPIRWYTRAHATGTLSTWATSDVREGQCALSLYQKMCDCDVSKLGRSAIVGLLKGCTKAKDLDEGSRIHSGIAAMGLLEQDAFVGSALVSMYAKCGLITKAQEVFDKVLGRDVVLWTALITAYAQNGQGRKALDFFDQMQVEGVFPNAATFVSALKACSNTGAIAKGQHIHAEILKEKVLEKDVFVGTALVDMYGKCGLLTKAQEVFDKLPVRSIVTWNALMAGYTQHGYAREALKCFELLQLENISPDAATFICTLRACGDVRDIDKSREIHAEIARKGLLESDLAVGNTLIDMYAKCGLLAKAQEVFHSLHVRDVVSWNTLISAYAQDAHSEKALNSFEQMQLEGISSDAVSIICSLKACGSIRATNKGQEIHAEVVKTVFEKNIYVGNSLIDMYSKCGLVAKAQEVFDMLPDKNLVSWNALISGYAQHNYGVKALECFEHMQREGVSPDAITLVCSLKACGSIGAIDKGREIHADISQKGLLETDAVVRNSLVDMYAKCGSLEKAQELFDTFPAHDVVSWTSLIAGYQQHGLSGEALDCFERMQLEGIPPNAVTFVCILKACGSLRATIKGSEIHAEIRSKGFLESNNVLCNAVIEMYVKCGLLARAQEVFDELPVRDVVSWNVLIGAYAQWGKGEEALKCCDQMHLEGISPDAVTFVCCLKACGSIGVLDKGQEIHLEILRKGLLETDTNVANALVDMYAKCGLLTKAREVFDSLVAHDVVSWTALISGYGQLGQTENAFLIWDKMIGEGIKPGLATFSSVLNACSHTGLLDKAQLYFENIGDPTIEHYTCMVDLFSRAGQLDKAVSMIKRMPFHADLAVWLSVLAACRKWGNVELGRQAFKHAIELDERDSSAYICLFNVYLDAGMREEANNIEVMRVERQAFKLASHSLLMHLPDIGDERYEYRQSC